MLRPNGGEKNFGILPLDLLIEHDLVRECIKEMPSQKSPSEQNHGL